MPNPVLMVHITPSLITAGRALFALAAAKRLNAALIGVAGCEPPAPIMTENGAVPPSPETERLLEAELRGLEQQFREQVSGLGEDKIDWRANVERPQTFVPRMARAADLVIVSSRTDETFDIMRLDPADVLLGAGRPVLTVPDQAAELDPSVVVLAWKDAPQARRAALDGLMLMQRAKRVIVLGVGRGADKAALEDVSAWLFHHEIKSEIRFDGDFRGETGPHIRHVAEEAGAGLIICGAYGRSRMREFVLGGVTRDLLKNAAVPCLMAH